MALDKKKKDISYTKSHRGLFFVGLLIMFTLIFKLVNIVFFKPKLGQEALYLDALDTERGKSVLEVYDPTVSFKIDFKGLPDNILRSKKAVRGEILSYINIPSGELHYQACDIAVNRQKVFLNDKGSIQLKDVQDPYLTFKRIFQSGSSSKKGQIGYGWTHNYNYQLFNVGEVFTLIDWLNNIYTFSFDYREERFYQISGLSSELLKEGDNIIWISPEKNQFTFHFNNRFASYNLAQIKTREGRVLNLKSEKDSGKISNIRDTASDLELTFQYGVNGFVSQLAFADKIDIQYNYDDYGNLISVKNLQTGFNEEYSYKSYLDIHDVTKIQSLRNNYDFIYESNKRIKAVLHPERKKTILEYDDILGIIRITDVEGHVYKYICEGKASLKVVDPIQNENFLFYDNSGHIVKAVFSNGSYVVRKYNDLGKIIEKEVAPDSITYFDYNNDSGIMAKSVNPVGKMIKYEFNEVGLPVKKIGYSKDEVYLMEYDSFGRLSGINDPSDNDYTIQYDSLGNVKKIISSSGWETFYEYDVLGRCRIYVDAEGNKLENTYNDQKNIKTTFYPEGSSKVEQYDHKGNILKKTENKITTHYQYDASGNLAEVTDPFQRKSVFRYDGCGNLTYKKDSVGREFEFQYDSLSRMTAEKNLKTNSLIKYEYLKDMGADQKLFNNNYTKKIFADGEILTRKFNNLMQVVEIVEAEGKRKRPVDL